MCVAQRVGRQAAQAGAGAHNSDALRIHCFICMRKMHSAGKYVGVRVAVLFRLLAIMAKSDPNN